MPAMKDGATKKVPIDAVYYKNHKFELNDTRFDPIYNKNN
jgi:hypothetical protein